jgi:hypothetical protein
MRRAAFETLHVVIAATMLAALGCGDAGPQRVAVEGTVTLDGAPLRYGSILFTPSGGARGPRAGGVIVDGHYAIPQSEGPLPGELLVEIHAPKLPAEEPLPEEESARFKRAAEAEELLPARYHAESALRVTATLEGVNRFDFELVLERAR